MSNVEKKPTRVEKVRHPRKKQKLLSGSSTARTAKALKEGPLENLAWQEVELPDRLEDAEGFFGLDEIENVEVIRDGQSGRLQYRVVGDDKDASAINESVLENDENFLHSMPDTDWEGFSDEADQAEGPVQEKGAVEGKRKKIDKGEKRKKMESKDSVPGKPAHKASNAFELLDESEDDGVDASAWNSLHLSPITLFSLAKMKFEKPTPIQLAAIPQIRSGHDVIGKASTGSGKTLAFGIPILEHFLTTDLGKDTDAVNTKQRQHPPIAMILSPTRELAHQLGDHLTDLCSRITPKSPAIVAITGGLSLHKQQRILNYADIIIGTPGRLWEIVSSTAGLLKWLRQIKFLVLDEADRLLSEGHFKEVEEILNSLDRKEVETSDEKKLESEPRISAQRQTLVFSATFEKDLQQKLAGKGKYKGEDVMGKQEAMGYLLEKLNFRTKPKFIDVNPVSQMAEKLKEGLVECDAMEKDLYLYTVLLHYPNIRTLVFTNSISSVRRLTPFLQDLGLPALALHSQMPQKARLRSIERFSSASNSGSILIATDVAARGLDIPSVQLVVHYHAPRAADMYVHRSGRTARAEQSGSSILLCSPEEVTPVRRLIAKVHARKAGGPKADQKRSFYIQTLDLDRRIVARLKPRVALAKKISDSTLAKEKQGQESNWLRTAAADLGVEYDSEEFAASEGTTKGRGMGRKKKMKEASAMGKQELDALRAELRGLLAQRINVGVSENYLTAGGVDVEELLSGGGRQGEFLGRVEGLNFD